MVVLVLLVLVANLVKFVPVQIVLVLVHGAYVMQIVKEHILFPHQKLETGLLVIIFMTNKNVVQVVAVQAHGNSPLIRI